MDKILHHQGWWISHYLYGFNHPRWCTISSINSISPILNSRDTNYYSPGNDHISPPFERTFEDDDFPNFPRWDMWSFPGGYHIQYIYILYIYIYYIIVHIFASHIQFNIILFQVRSGKRLTYGLMQLVEKSSWDFKTRWICFGARLLCCKLPMFFAGDDQKKLDVPWLDKHSQCDCDMDCPARSAGLGVSS